MSDDNFTTRRNPEMERYVDITPTVCDGFPDAQVVWLKVGNQSFKLDNFSESMEEAEWMRDMLCVALAKIVRDNTP